MKLRSIVPAALAAAFMGGVVALLRSMLPGSALAPRVAIFVLAGALAYAIALFPGWQRAFADPGVLFDEDPLNRVRNERESMPPKPLTRLRQLCLALPEAHEVEAWGEPTFRVRKKMFVMFASATNHHGTGRDAAWIKAAPGEQELLVRTDPDAFFVPPYVGPSGWVGAWLDNADWMYLAEIIQDAYRLVAPKRLIARLHSS